jgi:hypothetical protein
MSSLKVLNFKNDGSVCEDKKYRAVIKMNKDTPEISVDEEDEPVNNYINGFHNYKLLSVVIPSKCKYLGNPSYEYDGAGAFENCGDLKNVVIDPGSELEIVCFKCFFNCKELETIDFRNCNKLYEINGAAFSRCDKLTKIYMNLHNNYVDCFGEFSGDANGNAVFDSNNISKSAIVSGVVRTLAGDEYKLEDIEIPFWKSNGTRDPPSNLNELFFKQYKDNKELNLKSPNHFSLYAPTAGLIGSGEIISLTKEDYKTVKEWELRVIPKIRAERTEPTGNPPIGSGGHVDLEKMVLKYKDIPETPSSGKKSKRAKSLPTTLSRMTKKASRRRSLPNKLYSLSRMTNNASRRRSLPNKLSGTTQKVNRSRSYNKY